MVLGVRIPCRGLDGAVVLGVRIPRRAARGRGGPPHGAGSGTLSTERAGAGPRLVDATTLARMETVHPHPETESAPVDETPTDPRRTWRVPDDRRLPTLEPYADDCRRYGPVVVRETLWDSTDRVLAAEGIELLRGDDGWTIDRGDGPEPLEPDLDRPETDDRAATDELAATGDGSAADDSAATDDAERVPRDAVEVFLRGRALGVVRLRSTTTTLVRLRGRDGRVRAEVADVRVDEGDPDAAVLRSARWWALTDDGRGGGTARAVERTLDDALSDAPGTTATSADGRASRADRAPRPGVIRRAGTGRRPRRGSAAAFVVRTLRSLRAELVAVDPRVRHDDHEAVHEFRKVLRRLRSVLAVFRGALDRDATESLRADLASVARVAGVVRDAEVVRDRLPHAAGRAPAGFVDPDTLARVGAQADETRAAAAAELRRTLRSPEWAAALDALDDLVSRAPRGPHADDEASAFVVRRITRERRRVVTTAARRTDTLDDLHEVRKAARRLRYALQAAGARPGLGKRRLGRLRRVQETLGAVLDAEHAAQAHRETAVRAARDGHDTFGHGVLAATEHATGEQERDRGRRRVARLVARL